MLLVSLYVKACVFDLIVTGINLHGAVNTVWIYVLNLNSQNSDKIQR